MKRSLEDLEYQARLIGELLSSSSDDSEGDIFGRENSSDDEDAQDWDRYLENRRREAEAEYLARQLELMKEAQYDIYFRKHTARYQGRYWARQYMYYARDVEPVITSIWIDDDLHKQRTILSEEYDVCMPLC